MNDLISDFLREVESTVNGDRKDSYGDAMESFSRIAAMWSAITGGRLLPSDVALMMIALKVSRLITDPGKRDSWVDIAGYAALGAALTDDGETDRF